MDKLIEINGQWVLVLCKTIEINGNAVVTQGDIKILGPVEGPHQQQQGGHSQGLKKHPDNSLPVTAPFNADPGRKTP